MPNFPSYSRDELIERARNHFRVKVLGCDVADGSDYDLKARLIGTVAHGMQLQSSTILRFIDKQKSFASFLKEHAYEVAKIVAPQTATGKLLIRGTASATQTNGSALTSPDGLSYSLTADAILVNGTAASYHVGFRPGRKRVRIGGVTTGGTPSYTPALPAAGAVLQSTATSEYVAVRYVGASTVSYHAFVDLWTELTTDHVTETDKLTQVWGIVASATASTAGAAHNRDPGDTLTITSPVANVNAEAIVLTMTGGSDAMSEGELQAGITAWGSSRSPFLTMNEFRDLYLDAFPDLGELYVSPGLYGMIDLLPLGPNGRQAVTAAQAADIKAAAQPVLPLPYSDTAGSLVTTQATGVQLDTSYSHVLVQCGAPYRPDWELADANRTAGFHAVAASPASTVSRVYTDVDNLYVGARVIVSNRLASGFLTPCIEQRYVTAVGANYIDLDSPLTLPPNSTHGKVTPGGPLGDLVIDAIYALYESSRPEVGANARIIYPDTATRSAETGLLSVLKSIEGVVDVALVEDTPITPVLAGLREPSAWSINMV